MAEEDSEGILEAARSIIDLRFSDAQVERMRELADRNNQGVLTDAERLEMEEFQRIGSYLSILKAKSRLWLKDHGYEDND
jgi:hypothetical protein